jgi:hypothetical protein
LLGTRAQQFASRRVDVPVAIAFKRNHFHSPTLNQLAIRVCLSLLCHYAFIKPGDTLGHQVEVDFFDMLGKHVVTHLFANGHKLRPGSRSWCSKYIATAGAFNPCVLHWPMAANERNELSGARLHSWASRVAAQDPASGWHKNGASIRVMNTYTNAIP